MNTEGARITGRLESGTESEGAVIAGRYVLIGDGPEDGPLGEGAFGSVWKAHEVALDREVALKILSSRVSSSEVLLRFELERQILARMEHPNIARVYDGGTLPDRRPYLAMELVRGRTLDAHYRAAAPSVRESLDLMVQVCRAIHHAHERFILHRDLKPSNIMVAIEGDRAVPKVIDFGVAKVLTEGDFSADPGLTIDTSIKGSPAYMSPEQTRPGGTLTVRSDVYSLGAILYELIAGDTPIPRGRARTLDLLGLVEAIRNDAPAAPSTHRAQLSAVRRTTPPPVLDADLDAICLHALEKEPERRYSSAAELAADLERYLRNEPVAARRPSLWYLLRKYVQRHRALSAAAVVGLGALLLTAGVSTWSSIKVRSALGRESAARHAAQISAKQALDGQALAEAERVRAEEARKFAESKEQEATTARDAAVLARTQAEELINYMLHDLREELEPLGRSRLLAGLSERAEQYFARQPELTEDDSLERNRGVMHYNRGHILLAEGNPDRALDQFRAAETIMVKRRSGADEIGRRIDAATAHYGSGLALRANGLSKAAGACFEKAGAELATAHKTPEAILIEAAIIEQSGEMDREEGKMEEALSKFQAQEELLISVGGDVGRGKSTVLALSVAKEKIGLAWLSLSQPAKALEKFQEEIELLRWGGVRESGDLALRRNYAVALEKYADALLMLGRTKEAMPIFQERLEQSELLAKIDPRRPQFRRDICVAHHRLAAALFAAGDLKAAGIHSQLDLHGAEELARENPSDSRASQDLAASRLQAGLIRLKNGDAAEARAHLEGASEILIRLRGQERLDASGKMLLSQIERALAQLRPGVKSATRAESR